MMDIEPEVRKEQRRMRDQSFIDDEGPEEIEGMTERPHKTHELESSPFRIFFYTVSGCLLAGLVIGGIVWLFFL